MNESVPVVVAILLSLLAVVVAVVAGVTSYCLGVGFLRHLNRPTPGLLWATLREVPASFQVGLWRLRGATHARSLRVLPIAADSADGLSGADVIVVLLHGAFTNSTCLNGWARAIVDEGIEAPIVAPNHGIHVRALNEHARRLRESLNDLVAVAPQARLLFAAHSMGGLVLRRVLADDDDLRQRTIGALTVATPHRGTQLAKTVPLPPIGHLALAHADFATLPPLADLVPRVICMASDVDAIVYPAETCLPEATEHGLITRIGHGALLSEEVATKQVAAAVRRLMD